MVRWHDGFPQRVTQASRPGCTQAQRGQRWAGRRWCHRAIHLAVLACLPLCGPAALAQATWKGEGQGFFANDWIEPFNWIGNTPPDRSQGAIPLTVVFVGPGSTYQGGAVSNLDRFFGSYTAAGLRFNLNPDPVLAPGVPGAFALTSDPGVFLTVNGGGMLLNNVVNTSTSSILIGLSFGGTADLHQRGAGLLTLTGNNSYNSSFLDRGVLSVSSDANLGQSSGLVRFSKDAVLHTTASFTAASRDFLLRITPAFEDADRMSFDVAGATVLTLGAGGQGGALRNQLALAGELVKRGDGTLALASLGNTFYGRVDVAAGTLDLSAAGPRATALRSMPVSLQAGAVLGSVGPQVAGSALRTGELTGAPGGSVLAPAGLIIRALADAESHALVSLGQGGLTVSGIAEQRLLGSLQGDGVGVVQVNTGATLVLGGAATLSQQGMLLLAGGTLVAEGGPRLVSNQGAVLLGGELQSRGGTQLLGAVSVSSGASKFTTTDGGAWVVSALSRTGTGSGTIDLSGPVAMTGPQPLTHGIVGHGWATVDGKDWATVTQAGAIAALAPSGYAPLGALLQATPAPVLNGLLTDSSQLTLLDGVQYHTLKIASSGAGQALVITTPFINATAGNLSTNALLLTGSHDYEIRNGGPNGTGVLSALGGSGELLVRVDGAERTLKVKTDLQASRIVKTGDGVLELDRSPSVVGNSFSGSAIEFRINEGSLRGVVDGNLLLPVTLPLDRSSFSLRGGQLEFVGGNQPADSIRLAIGAGPGAVNWASSPLDQGSGGFAARLRAVTLSLSGAAVWGEGAFVQDGQRLVLGAGTATEALTVRFADGLSLGAASTAYALREIRVVEPGITGRAVAVLGGGITGDPWKDLLKTGNGTLVLESANSYQGGTLVAEGTLALRDSQALGSGPIAGTPAGPYVLLGGRGGSADAAIVLDQANVVIARDMSVQAGSTGHKLLGMSKPGSAAFSGQVLLRDDLQIDVREREARLVFGSPDTGFTGEGAIDKIGPGTADFRGPSTYSGATTVREGRLLVNNTTGSGTGSSAVTVKAGAVLGGNGFMQERARAEPGGVIAPGNSVGTLTSGASITLDSRAIYEWELLAVGLPAADSTGLSAAAGHDLLVSTESFISLESDTVVRAIGLPGFDAGFQPQLSYSWLLARAGAGILLPAGLAPNVALFAPAGANGIYTLSTARGELYLNYAPVPEPATWGLLLSGLLAVTLALRRKGA